jgi:hypothetical protein
MVIICFVFKGSFLELTPDLIFLARLEACFCLFLPCVFAMLCDICRHLDCKTKHTPEPIRLPMRPCVLHLEGCYTHKHIHLEGCSRLRDCYLDSPGLSLSLSLLTLDCGNGESQECCSKQDICDVAAQYLQPSCRVAVLSETTSNSHEKQRNQVASFPSTQDS